MGCCETAYNDALARPAHLVLAVCAALIDQDGRILVTRRPDNKPYGGFWEFPGGKLEENESPQAALSRELKEELAIYTCCGCFHPFRFISHPYPDCHALVPVFSCRFWEGIPRGVEGQELRWIRPEDAKTLSMLEGNASLISELRGL